MQLTVTVEPSAASLPGWDELVIGDGTELPSHDLFLSAKVLHVFEVFGNKAPQHVLARANGTLVGGLATYRLDEHVTDRLMRLDGVFPGMDVLPARLVGGLYDGRTGALTLPSLGEEARRQVVSRLFAEAEDIARRNDEASVVCRCVDGGDTLLRDVLRDRGYREIPGPDHFVLVPPPGGLDGYIDSLPSRYRNKVRRELRKLREGGVAITVEPLTPDLIRTVAPLIVNLYNKYNIDEDCDLITARLGILRKVLKPSIYGVVARVGDRVVGFNELIVYRGNAWTHHVGFDYEAQGTLPVYFGVFFYGVMDFAAEHGLPVLDYSFKTEDAKRSRGCEARVTVRLLKAV
jgi:predicted N-acyltransferase